VYKKGQALLFLTKDLHEKWLHENAAIQYSQKK
jgi:hypothetical protein